MADFKGHFYSLFLLGPVSWGKEFRAFLTPRQIQYGGFERAILKKSGDTIRDEVRILRLLLLWFGVV